jgi:large subunit ribosomal protein L7e
VQIKSNAQVEQHLGGDIICLEDIINEIYSVGKNFQQITNFIFPFKLTTPEGTLASRLRKPVDNNGHWGYRAEDINQYVELMI